jgi:superfamily II DNA or RNA helicase
VTLQLTTAGGKTACAAVMTRECVVREQRVLFVCHKREILQQASEALTRAGVPHGLVASGWHMGKSHLVQIALVGSLPARIEGLDPDLIIFDECHHISAPTWRQVAESFPSAKRLGLTATPRRLDRRALTPFFTTIVSGPSQKELRAKRAWPEKNLRGFFSVAKVLVLSNCEIFTEGFDLPSINAVILLRPTHSTSLYLQMVGRAMRPDGNIVHILDHAALVYEQDLPDVERKWSLDGASPKTKGTRTPLRKCPECKCVHPIAGSCPNCGHEYPPADRSVTTVDGTLIIVKETHFRPAGQAPKGMMTLRQYARYAGRGDGNVRHLLRLGMPRDPSGFVDPIVCDDWLAARKMKTAAKRAERMKALHADPVFAAKNAERMRKRMQALNSDPVFAAKRDERTQALNSDPVFAAKNVERMKALNAARRAAKEAKTT